MRVLVVKTSSLGDIVHTLPAIEDARQALPGVEFDWVVEKGFAQAALWHPSVVRAIPCQIRQWRKAPLQALRTGQWQAFLRELKRHEYDRIIDAQGLIKSAVIARLGRGRRTGFNQDCARESVAAYCYHESFAVDPSDHAIARVRALFAQALGYALPTGPIDYGLSLARFEPVKVPPKTLVFVHGTTWETKHWPEKHWETLAHLASEHGFQVWLPWGSPSEKQRAQRIAQTASRARVLPRLNLNQVASLLAGACGVVAVDSGLSHITAAVGTPAVTLYGSTDPARTGTRGAQQHHLTVDYPCTPCLKRQCPVQTNLPWPPCYNTLTPERVWDTLMANITERETTPCLQAEQL